MTAALRHALAWERTPPGVTVATLVVASGLAITGALQFPYAQWGEREPPAPRVSVRAPSPPPSSSPSAAPSAAPSTVAETVDASMAPSRSFVDARGDAGDAAVAVAAPTQAAAADAGVAAPAGPVDPRCPPRWSIRFRRGSWSAPQMLAVHFVPLRSFLSKNPRANVLVLGYADPLGTDRDNHALSVRRAAAVAVSIRRAGVAPARVTVGGVGAFTAEVEGVEDSDALRRVEVRVRGVAPCAGVPEEVVGP